MASFAGFVLLALGSKADHQPKHATEKIRPQAVRRVRQLVGSPIERWLDQQEGSTDEKFPVVSDAIRQLMAPPEPKRNRLIGFLAHIEK